MRAGCRAYEQGWPPNVFFIEISSERSLVEMKLAEPKLVEMNPCGNEDFGPRY